MTVLLDACVPRPLKRFLTAHTVKTAADMGWAELKNGALLKAAEQQFDVFITADQGLKTQQTVPRPAMAIVVLSTNNWPLLKANGSMIAVKLEQIRPGDYIEITIP